MKKLEQVVAEKREWIYTKLETKGELRERAPTPREYVSGEGFYYLGRTHRLKLIQPSPGVDPLRLHEGWFKLHRDRVDEGEELFKAWYREHLRPRVRSLAEDFTRRLEVQHNGIHIMDLGHRWGSCGKTNRLNFHWRTAMLPPELIEYVVAHEVAHLRDPHHSPEFWVFVERLVPDFRQRKGLLAKQGARFDL